MVLPKRTPRSILKRRGSISTAVQTVLDLVVVLGLALALVHRQYGVLPAAYSVLLLLLAIGMLFAYDQFGVYRSNSSFARKALTLLKAWSLAFAFLLVVGFATKQTDVYSRLLLGQLYVGGYAVQVLLHYFSREIQTRVMRRAVPAENVLIIGTGKLARYLQAKISGNPWLNQNVVGCLELPGSQARQSGKPAASLYHSSDFAALKEAEVIGNLEDMLDIIERHDVRTVYFAIPLGDSDLIEEMYFRLLDRHVAVHWVPDIFSLLLVNHSVREMAGLPVLTLSETPLTGTRLLLKAVEDRVLATLILLLVAPVLLLIALAIRLDSPGPVFFRQARKGWSGKVFHIWKFRSMHVHQPEGGVVQQATRDDPRITRVGAFLRKTSLDELPQVFNVLTGEMSLVGPRPHAVQHDEEYSKRIDAYLARHNIKPGITGLAQVRGLRGETRDVEQMQQRIEADIEYINNWSLWLDLSILVRTLGALTGKNAY
ncbi:MAG TPA: undecaprenyl-phosphate glucose phosphotransferase [Hydrogenophaga sp.]|uniref:undecaprenyl-phosphate glucose phosphotransferase n=1 Tax=Hydrogenophaga sp. TaxID=1904254 RepID=UPI002C17ED62|nr:undecaprenyl-phosphate glucose phosphotransferase [Hydrogenophaga sp.]HMN92021.1 undecaprenyl-phosphate glucose phosphotransferase [Hydrogenophaga sp.]HMP08822.1 undecaprenyl-phosphate glucose phosphotransferase [Hydrogenophaga sp.]